MADDVILNPGVGGETCATDQVAGGQHYQIVKLADGVANSTAVVPAPLGKGLYVQQPTAADLNATVVGTVTANAGTNLNTSLLALEAGNLAAIAGMDFATQTTLAALNAKLVTGTDIGDVTINNGAAAAAVNIQDGGNVITVDGTVAVTNADITSCKTALELLDNAVDGNYLNINQNIAGTDVAAGAGAVSAQVQRITLASDDPAVTALQVIDNCISGSEAQVDVVAALPAGTNVIGDVALSPRAAGGATGVSSRISTADDNDFYLVHAGACNLLGGWITNQSAAIAYVKIYDHGDAPAPATETPILRFAIPGATTGGGGVFNISCGINIAAGLGVVVTTGQADAGATHGTAGDIIVNLWYAH